MLTKRAIVMLLLSIISALVGVVVVLGAELWNRQPTCSDCGANIGAGILLLFGWVWLVLSLIALAASVVRVVVHRLRRPKPARQAE